MRKEKFGRGDAVERKLEAGVGGIVSDADPQVRSRVGRGESAMRGWRREGERGSWRGNGMRREGEERQRSGKSVGGGESFTGCRQGDQRGRWRRPEDGRGSRRTTGREADARGSMRRTRVGARGGAGGWSEIEVMVAQRSGGGGGGGGLRTAASAVTMEKNPWSGQGVAAVDAAAAAVGLFPWPSLSSHLRGRSLLSFFK